MSSGDLPLFAIGSMPILHFILKTIPFCERHQQGMKRVGTIRVKFCLQLKCVKIALSNGILQSTRRRVVKRFAAISHINKSPDVRSSTNK